MRLVTLLLIACGGQVSGGDATTDTSTDNTISNDDALLGGDVAKDSGENWHYYDDGGSACLPDADASFFFERYSCCEDGALCYGDCLVNDLGDLKCDCYGLSGGCTNGLVCCHVTFNCISHMYCLSGK